MPRSIITLVAISLALAACTSGMDSAECVTADWQAIGYEDGAQGQGAGSFGARRKACAEHGVTPDFQAYMAGRDKGLTQFCRPQNGYQLGKKGYRYSGVCPVELEPEFQAAHTTGFGLYQRRVTVSRIGKRLRKNKRRADKIEIELVEKTAQLISTGIEITRRATIGVEIKQLAEEKVELKFKISELEREYDVAKQVYEEYRHLFAFRHGG